MSVYTHMGTKAEAEDKLLDLWERRNRACNVHITTRAEHKKAELETRELERQMVNAASLLAWHIYEERSVSATDTDNTFDDESDNTRPA